MKWDHYDKLINNYFKYSCLIYNMVNISGYNPYQQKFFGAIDNFGECVKGSWLQNTWEPLIYDIPIDISISSPPRGTKRSPQPGTQLIRFNSQFYHLVGFETLHKLLNLVKTQLLNCNMEMLLLIVPAYYSAQEN